MRKICVINQKGGVGKTTTTVNIASGLAMQGKKVLIVDFDAQGNIASSLNLDGEKNIYHVLVENADIRQCTRVLGKNLDIIPSKETLTKTELLLATRPNKEFILREKLKGISGYDYVIIDCPPSLGLLNQNALLYAEEAFIPVATDYLGYDALRKMESVVEKINEHFDHTIKITKVIPTMFDKRNKTCRVYLDKISSKYYEKTTAPIRINSKLKEAPEAGKSIYAYAPSSRGAKDYLKLVNVVLNEEERILADYASESESEDELVPLNNPDVIEELKKKANKARA